MGAQLADPISPAQRRRAVLAVTLGNGLEFYDFVTYAYFAIQIGHAFFPSHSSFLSLMGSLATFGAGFTTRPLGAHVLGGYADRHGRRPAMMISMLMMGGGIALLALTPSYATLGIAAPVLAVMARLIQGFALGGEVGCSTVYMIESAAARRRGFVASFQIASQTVSSAIGAAVGLGLSLALTPVALAAWGWRLALLLGVTVVPLALFVRNSLHETLDTPEPPAAALPQRYRRVLVCGFLIILAGTTATYIFQYMATYGQNTLHLRAPVAFAGQLGHYVAATVAALFGGWVSDRYGRRPVMIAAQSLFCLVIAPCFLLLVGYRGAASFIGVNITLGLISPLIHGPAYSAINESLPRAIRARAFALVYALPVAIFGGSTQFVVTWLLHVTGDPLAVAWYMTGTAMIGLAAMVALSESAPVRVNKAALA